MLNLNLEYNNFDWINYVFYYEDLKKDNISTKEKAWKHWITHGKKEGRQFFSLNEMKKFVVNNIENNSTTKDNIICDDENFNWIKYVSYYSDLKNDNINTKEKAYNHWIKYGKNEGRIYFDNNAEYENFDWKTYVNINTDLQYIKTKENAWEHWYKHGKQENRTFFDLTKSKFYKNELEKFTSKYIKETNEIDKEEPLPRLHTSGKKESKGSKKSVVTKTCKYDFENSFFINLACHYLSIKYNIAIEYMYNELFKKFGIELFIGKNTYKTDFVITNDNFFTLINDSNNINAQIKENISLSDDLHCITKDFCLYVKKNYYDNNETKNKIVNCNLFKERYVQNNDLYLHICTEYVDNDNLKNIKEYYTETIKKVTYDTIYISSDNIKHEICKTLITTYSAKICDKEICEKIMFANTCKYLILSSDVLSLLIGLFNFFSKHTYYPIILGSKYNEIFDSFHWKGIDVTKIITQPKLTPHPSIKNQAPSPTEEWYDSPFIRPKPEKNEPTKLKPILKVRFQQESHTDEPIKINFEKFY